MYCSSCGVAVAKGVTFCNYCGAKLPSSDTEMEFREVKPGLLVSAMAGIFVLGLPGIVFLLFMLNAVRLDPQQSMAFAWTALLLLVALEVVFLLLLLRRKPRRDESTQTDRLPGSQTKELEEKYGGSLAEPVSSVTEQTTRAFDSIPRDRN
jgi:membrane protein implicated in regulation of membrane protease activity